MSADPVGGLLGGAIDHHVLDDAPLEQHQLVDGAGQTPDFWLDANLGDLDQHLYEIEQTLTSANNLTGVTQARSAYGFIGTGQTVAVVDSGIAYDHYALGGGLGADFRVVGGWDFTESDANPYDDGTSGSHGTHVSGIIGADSGSSSSSGVAPGVDLVGLRVFNDAGEGYFSWVESALQWVHQNRNTFENPITAVNLSLGTSWNSESVPSWAMLEDEFAQLETDGIFISVSAGNSFTSYNTTGLSYPAASSHVVPVMSVDDSGLLSYFSQRSQRAIAAPGRYVYSTIPDYAGNHNGVTDDWANFSGTSMAAPYVAGASVLVREAMEFVGYTGITQQTIYDHMIATADQFYDSATSQYYNRLDVGAAIDALIPDDEFGSSVLDAYDLGTLSADNALSLSGLIGKLDDVDFFTFTAGATGTVSFTAAATHSLAAAWTSVGGDAQLDGDTYTLDVLAGQTYSVGLSTTDGLGYYELSVSAESSFTYIDWGTVAQTRLDSVNNQGESWYRMQASRDGYLTAQALLSDAGGDLDLFLYDHNLQPLLAASAAGDYDRVDALAAAGDEFFLRVIGTAADVEFQLTNLVSVDGSTVNITGTEAADTFSFAAGDTLHTVGINGVAYQLNAAVATVMNFDGGAGEDTITLTGTAGDETATLRAGSVTLVGTSFRASATGVENVRVYSGGGRDAAYFNDSSGDDSYRAWSDHAVMFGTGYFNVAYGFDSSAAYATAGGLDRAVYYDSPGDDRFEARREWSRMTGSDFNNSASGFEANYAYATAGGLDRAIYYDSPGDDRFEARREWSRMTGSDFNNFASGFEANYAYATAGGLDRAIFYDSSGDDVFTTRPDWSRMTGGGFNNFASGFDANYAYATAGGLDRAIFYDSSGDDVFTTRPDWSRMMGGGFNNFASGFDANYAYATAGGLDRAVFYDSQGNDQFEARRDWSRMTGSSSVSFSSGFERVTAIAENGTDEAEFEEIGTLDEFSGSGSVASLRIGTTVIEAIGFDSVVARAKNGESPNANVSAIDYALAQTGNWS
jgi:subtilisin family serine protease